MQKERRVSKLSLAVPCPRASAALAGAAAAIAAIDYQVLLGLISGLFQCFIADRREKWDILEKSFVKKNYIFQYLYSICSSLRS